MQNVGRYADILFRAVYNQEKEMVVSQMGEEFIKYSRDVFMMHDIGRHYIPVSILNKVEKLTEEEIQIIKNHTVDVAKAIDSVYEQPYPESVMEHLLQISLYHHERYDGGGYPLGLKGEEIALGARICAIAMAKELDFTVITEGIETAEQVKFLVEIGCDIGQGYYFSKPVDIRAFDQLNRTMVTTLYRPDEYYPTFEDYERDIDLIVQMFSEVARYENFFKEENSGT